MENIFVVARAIIISIKIQSIEQNLRGRLPNLGVYAVVKSIFLGVKGKTVTFACYGALEEGFRRDFH